MELWPHQKSGLAELYPELVPGNSVCVTSPTGGGKTRMICEVLKLGTRQTVYTARRMLRDQLAVDLTEAGIAFGMRAAGHAPSHWEPIQIAMVQTEDARVLKGTLPLHPSEVIHIDEAHGNKEAVMCELIRQHVERGAAVIGWTASPLGIGHIYKKLIVAGTPSELRACGALVPAHHYGPDEPDMTGFKRTQKTGEYTQGDVVKAIMTHSIVGRVVDQWRRVNPDQKPTLLFAPGVAESIWFAEHFTANGIPAGHIDGDNVWLDGEFYQSDQAARDELRARSESGAIKIVCNRFVMREGVNWPHLYCGINATVFGSLTSYLQANGRLLRAHPSMDHVVIQDHGGNWWRHGSVNSDREWFLDRSDYVVSAVREERLRGKKEPQPICCPKCFAIRLSGPKCYECGYVCHTRSRFVIQRDGSLKEMQGDVFKPRRTDNRPDVERRWTACYWRCKKSGKTFSQARGLFCYENNWLYPPKGLPLMPRDEIDFFRKISDVPMHRLITSESHDNESRPDVQQNLVCVGSNETPMP